MITKEKSHFSPVHLGFPLYLPDSCSEKMWPLAHESRTYKPLAEGPSHMSWPGFLEWKRPWVCGYTGSHMHRNSTSFLESNPKISLCFEEDLERDFRIWIFVFETRSLVNQAASLCSGEHLELLLLLPPSPKCREYRCVHHTCGEWMTSWVNVNC